jgi:hypothetical protein
MEKYPDEGWVDVPSVTTALGILEKPALPWWGMKVGVEGVLELRRKRELWPASTLRMSGAFASIARERTTWMKRL